MKRLSISAVILLVAVSVGGGVSVLWQRPRTQPYCEVARNSERYHNRIIRVKATLFFNSDGVHIYEDCDPMEALMSLVDLSDASGIDTDSEANVLLIPAQNSTLKKVDAIIEGRFNGKFSLGCWGPKYRIAATKVELLTPVSESNPPPLFSEEGLRLKH